MISISDLYGVDIQPLLLLEIPQRICLLGDDPSNRNKYLFAFCRI